MTEIVKLVMLAQDLLAMAWKMAEGHGVDRISLAERVERARKKRDAALEEARTKELGVFDER